MSIIKTFLMMLIGVLLAPPLASGISTALSDSNITGTASASIIGVVLTIYAILILYAGAKGLGVV